LRDPGWVRARSPEPFAFETKRVACDGPRRSKSTRSVARQEIVVAANTKTTRDTTGRRDIRYLWKPIWGESEFTRIDRRGAVKGAFIGIEEVIRPRAVIAIGRIITLPFAARR